MTTGHTRPTLSLAWTKCSHPLLAHIELVPSIERSICSLHYDQSPDRQYFLRGDTPLPSSHCDIRYLTEQSLASNPRLILGVDLTPR